MPELTVLVERLPHAEGLALPAYATPGSAGLDLLAAVPAEAPLLLEPGRHALVPTGLRLALPEGHEGQVRPRSGLALRHGVTVLNSPGTIDADYRGEVGVILINHGNVVFRVDRGLRIAQLVIVPVTLVKLREAPVDGQGTSRGEAGFGSTGMA